MTMLFASVNCLSQDKVFGEIIALVLAQDLEQMPDGINKIKGDDVFVNRIRGKARYLEGSQAEIHKEYIDIHLTLMGRETLGFVVEPEALSFMQDQPFNNDCELKDTVVNEQFITLEQGQYCVFYPQEWHRPMVQLSGELESVDKVVIKVRAALL